MSESSAQPLREALQAWETTDVARSVQRLPERPETEGIQRLYTPLDAGPQPPPLPDQEWYLQKLGFPGRFPFTRGIQPTMYRGRFWTMRQYAGYGTAAEANERFKYLLSQGQTGLSVAFDLATQIGYDSDDPRATGEVGQAGVAIDSLADMEALLEGIPLDKVSISMTINAPAAVLLAMVIVTAEKRGITPDKLTGTIQNDILKEYVARGTYIFPPEPSVRLAADTIAYCARHVPRWNPISVSGYHIRDAGSTAAQEMAFAIANALTYIDAVLARGIAIDDFAPRISWIFNTHSHFFEEIAKYRALRRLWAHIMRDDYGARKPESMMLRTHIQTGGATLTAQQPLNNIARAAFQALASVLGGIQSMALSCYDEALALPTEEAQATALRTQQIIAHEIGVTEVIDPLAGSYYVEALTDRLEAEARALLDKVRQMGGAIKAIESGWIQQQIADSAWERQQAIESGRQIIVGVNKYQTPEEARPVGIFRPDPETYRRQCERLAALRAERDNAAVQVALARLQAVAQAPAGHDTNLMPPILEAVRAYATLGEICGALRQVWGEYVPPTVI
ncbi:MAG: methylmalonyl-CoA mutase family protein [Caldilineales bacterium]|nr:methylmalonyl-CoA mutase family protein [Caldilineales bacterium]